MYRLVTNPESIIHVGDLARRFGSGSKAVEALRSLAPLEESAAC